MGKGAQGPAEGREGAEDQILSLSLQGSLRKIKERGLGSLLD